MNQNKKRSSHQTERNALEFQQQLDQNLNNQVNEIMQMQFYKNVDNQEFQNPYAGRNKQKPEDELQYSKTSQPDTQCFEVYQNGYVNNLQSKSNANLGYDSNRSNLEALDRHNKSQASITSNRSNVSQRRGRSHRQGSRQSSRQQLPSVGQMPQVNQNSQVSPMMTQKQLIHNSNQKMIELISAQKSIPFGMSSEKPHLQISQTKFGINMSESSLEPYKPGNEKEFDYLELIQSSQKNVNANPIAEYDSIVNEYQVIRPVLDDKSKSDNKQYSTAKKRSPVVPKGKVTSSTNHKNDSQVQDDENQGRISKFVLPLDSGAERQIQMGVDQQIDYNECLNSPQIYKSNINYAITDSFLNPASSPSLAQGIQKSFVHDYVEKGAYASFENQKLKINDQPLSPTQDSPRFNEIMKIMSDDKRSRGLSESDGSKYNKSSKSKSKSKRTGKKSKAKSKLILQTLGNFSEEDQAASSNKSDAYMTQDLTSPAAQKSSHTSKKSSGQVLKENSRNIISPLSEQSSKISNTKSKRKKKRKSKNIDEGVGQNIEPFSPNEFMKELQLVDNKNSQPYQTFDTQKKKSSAVKNKKQSGKKPLRAPNSKLIYSPAKMDTNVRKNVQIEVLKQSKLLENIIMSPLNRGSSQFSNLFSDRKSNSKIPTEEIFLKKSGTKSKINSFQNSIYEMPHPESARQSKIDIKTCLEGDFGQLRSPQDSNQKALKQKKQMKKLESPCKKSNIPVDIVCFSPKNNQNLQKNQPLKPSFLNPQIDSSLQLKKQHTGVVATKESVSKAYKSSSELINDMHDLRRQSKSQLSTINKAQKAAKINKPKPELAEHLIFAQGENHDDVDTALNKALSASQRLSVTGRFHSRKSSTIAEYIQCMSSKNNQAKNSIPSTFIETKRGAVPAQIGNECNSFSTHRASSKINSKKFLPPKSSVQNTSAQRIGIAAGLISTSGQNSTGNLFSTQSNNDSSKKIAPRIPIAPTLQKQKQTQSCVALVQPNDQIQNNLAFGSSLVESPSKNGIKSSINIISSFGNLTGGSALSKATKTPSQAGRSNLIAKLIDSHEEIAVKTQESSQHRSKNSSDEKNNSQQIKREKQLVLDPGLEHILEQEDDVLDIGSQIQENVIQNNFENEHSPQIYNHMISNDSEMANLRRELFQDQEDQDANEPGIVQYPYNTNTEFFDSKGRLEQSEQSSKQAHRAKQKSQDMGHPFIGLTDNSKVVETPIRKNQALFKSSQKFSASQQLLADRRSRDRQKTQTRNGTGTLYQVRKMKSDQNGFLMNQITQPVGITSLRKKKPTLPLPNENSSGKKKDVSDAIQPQIIASIASGTSRTFDRPLLSKKQSLPVRDTSQLNIYTQKKQIQESISQNDFNLLGRNKKQSVNYQNNQIMQSLKNNVQSTSNTDVGIKDKFQKQNTLDNILATNDSGRLMKPILSKGGNSTKNNIVSTYNYANPCQKFTRMRDDRISNVPKSGLNNYVTQSSVRRYTNQSSVRNGNGMDSKKTPITQKIGPYGKGERQVKTTKKEPDMILLQSEKEKYGDRCPTGYKKISLLGKGGIALVWLAEVKDHKKCGLSESMVGQRVALKQFPKIRGQQTIDSSAKIEIETGNTLFPLQVKDGCSGDRDSDFERTYAIDPQLHPGMKSIARLIDQVDEKSDFWLVYEVGSQCLGKYLCEVKGEFYKGERIYNCSHQKFYMALARNSKILGTLVRKISEIFDVLSRFGIVHSDIKPDNILVELTPNENDIESIKLIDFGSAFQFHNVTQITATTPEYLAPEILAYLEDRNKNSKSNLSSALFLREHCQPWSFDVWSLGVILLEIVTGFPVWMSLKCRVSTVDGKSVLGSGIFGVQGREGKKIIVKQQQLLKNIKSTLKKYECYGLDQDQYFMDLLHRMLDFNPTRRISPLDIVNHPFCQN